MTNAHLKLMRPDSLRGTTSGITGAPKLNRSECLGKAIHQTFNKLKRESDQSGTTETWIGIKPLTGRLVGVSLPN
jgi:hypothetical protein